MQHNRMNGVMVTGHSSGEVMMWTPNMASRCVVKVLAHASAPITSLSVSKNGTYMATTGKDSRMKIWDIRNTYKCLYDYFTPTPAQASEWSDTGLLGVSVGSIVQVWKNTSQEKQKAPYMKYKAPSTVKSLKFIPLEDVLGIAHEQGYSSIVVPGSGEANFDAFEANPFATKKQVQEGLVHGLLEKLSPDTISLKVGTVGQIDTASNEIKAKEKREEEERALEEEGKNEKKRAKKMRGKSKIGNMQGSGIRQMHEMQREKNKLAYLNEFKQAKRQTETVTADLEFLNKTEGKFDAFESAITGQNSVKRTKK